MITFLDVPHEDFNGLIDKLDEKIAYVSDEFGIEINSYGYILRLALNAIQGETVDNLIDRLRANRELERELDISGYTIGFLEENNPKAVLEELLMYIRDNQPKQKILLDYLNKVEKSVIAVVDINDIDFIEKKIRNKKVKVMSQTAFKNTDLKTRRVVYISFNGKKDFDEIYHLNNDVKLVVYESEKNIYYKYLDKRKRMIEAEVNSNDRLKISGIEYKEVVSNIPPVSKTVEGIIAYLDEMSNQAYEGYKNEGDVLLSEIEEKLLYKVMTSRGILILESSDTVFSDEGDLKKVYNIKVGDRIRIYPKEELAENLYQLAVETEPEVFGKVEEHSEFWKDIVRELRKRYEDDLLYQKLKNIGLRVQQNTFETYAVDKSLRKFPMFNNDLRLILSLYFENKPNNEMNTILQPILKSKRLYNGAMIVLGRGLKQELGLYLKENIIGDILKKRNFNEAALKAFVDKEMPIHDVIYKEVFDDSIDYLNETTLQFI